MQKIAILLSTYNGERYIFEQIRSILEQSYSNFLIYIRDDGSCDNTLRIIHSFNDKRIVVVKDEHGNLGPARSFMELVRIVDADWYFFCDQDDIWRQDKIHLSIEYLSRLGYFNQNLPILLHSDLELVDANLKSYGLTFNQSEGVVLPQDQEFIKLLVQNCVVGCTTFVNRALINKSKIKNLNNLKIAMHDWWFALVASKFGKIVFLDVAPILYRQHGKNASGISSKVSFFSRMFYFFDLKKHARVNEYCSRISNQASEFGAVFGEQLAVADLKILKYVALAYRGHSLHSLIKCFFLGASPSRVHMKLAVLILILGNYIYFNLGLEN